MTDDEELRSGLRAIGQEYLPDGMDGIRESVLRRGRRTLFVRRTAAVAAAVVVIGGVGTGLAVVDTLTAVEPGQIPAAAGLQRGFDEDALLPGWTHLRREDGMTGSPCMVESTPEALPPPTTGTAADSPETVGNAPDGVPEVSVVEAAAREVLEDSGVTVQGLQGEVSGTLGESVVLEVRGDGGEGIVRIGSGAFQGQAGVAADGDTRCLDVQRKQTRDGAVLQLYPAARATEEHPIARELRVYRPDGSFYVLNASGDLPREDQLVRLGERLAE